MNKVAVNNYNHDGGEWVEMIQKQNPVSPHECTKYLSHILPQKVHTPSPIIPTFTANSLKKMDDLFGPTKNYFHSPLTFGWQNVPPLISTCNC